MTYGTLKHVDGDWKHWEIECKPHVAIKIKRTFSRAQSARTSVITITDTTEVARDLEWFILRYPLEMDPMSQAVLTARATQHKHSEETIARIFEGHTLQDDTWLTPARPHREYQQQAVDMASLSPGLLLADVVGLGKTQSATGILRDPAARPALVVTLTHLPKQWEKEINAIFPTLTTHVATKASSYEVDADVLIMNYAKMNGWVDALEGKAKSVIFDEVHELRRDGTAKHNAAIRLARAANYRIGASATPIFNYGGETHTIYDVLAPDVLGTRGEFLREWGSSERNGQVVVKDPEALGEYLRDQGVLLRRTRVDVHREMEDPIRITQSVDSNPAALNAVAGDAAAMARLILDTNGDAKEQWKAKGELDWKLRQATGIGKAPFVAEFVRMLLETEDKIVLFGWHHAVYEIWMDMLRGFKPVLFTGKESTTQKANATDQFVNGDSRVLIMSLRSGAGLDGLQEASSVAVFGELDWSPEVHTQAIGRLARDGQTATVVAYMMLSEHGADPVMAEVHELKRQQAEPMLDPGGALFQPVAPQTDRLKLLAQAVLDGTIQRPAKAPAQHARASGPEMTLDLELDLEGSNA